MNQEYKPEVALPSLNFPAFLEKIIMGGIIFIIALPLLGDYGNVLFPLGRDIIFKLTVELLIILLLLKTILGKYQAPNPNAQPSPKSQCPTPPSNLGFKKLGFHWSLVIGHWDFKKILPPITLSLLFFWLIMLFSTLNSVQTDFSIWGNIYKNQGLMTWTHYVLFFFLLISFLNDRKQWRFLINIAISVGTLVAVVALWQTLSSESSLRAASTLNNSNYLAAYLLLLIPITFAFFIKKPSLFLGFAVALQFLALIFTQTRGGYLGIAIAIFVFAFLYIKQRTKESIDVPKIPNHKFQITNKFKITNYKLQILTLATLVILPVVYYLVLATDTGQNFQQKLPDFTNRFLKYNNIKNDSGPRLEAWQAGWQGMLNKPLLGYGPENFFVAFDQFYSGSGDHQGSLARDGSLWETWFDKAHNFIFDIGVTTGFLGLFAYMAIFASAIWTLLKQKSIIAIGLTAALGGYLMQNLLGFDTFVTTMYLLFFLAFANFISNSRGQSPKISNFQFPIFKQIKNSNSRNVKRFRHWSIGHSLVIGVWSLGFIFLTILCMLSFNLHLNIFKANYNLNLAESLAQRGQISQAFAAYEKGLEYNSPPINPNLRRRYAVIALAYYDAVVKHCAPKPSGSDPDGLNTERCRQLYEDSEKYLNRALVLQKENAAAEWPRFTRNYIYAAQISHILGNYEESDMFFEKSLELSPSRASIYAEWARLLKGRGEKEEADAKLKKAKSINPKIQING